MTELSTTADRESIMRCDKVHLLPFPLHFQMNYFASQLNVPVLQPGSALGKM